MKTFLQTITRTVKHWYLPLIIGLILVSTGIYVFTVPLETYHALSVLFSASFIVIGLLDIFFSIRNHNILHGWGWHLVGGLLSLTCGVILIINPGISFIIMPFVVGFALLFISFFLLGYSFEMKSLGILNWGYTALLSVLGIIFSFLLIAIPLVSEFSLVVITGVSLIMAGVSSIVFSLDLRKVKRIPEKFSPELKIKITAILKEIEEDKTA